jgi:hypothetical protein
MKDHELTAPRHAATSLQFTGRTAAVMERQVRIMRRALKASGLVLAVGLAGCINIAAPDKPIVIELNINIQQEVIYRLAEDAQNTIEENADIF